jgi:SNF2 family DNA or RNA helicase
MTSLSTGSKNYKPHEYQQRAIKLMIGQACAGLFLDPGLGKTSISLAAAKILLGKKLIKGALVIAPLRACFNVWPQEIAKWDAFSALTCAIAHGAGKEGVLEGPQKDVYLINPEGVVWLADWLAKTPQSQWPFDTLIVDESTKFKTSNTQRFKALRGFLNKFRRRYILTGTPAPNGLLDLFGQIYILDQGHALGRFVTHYRNTHFYSTGFGGYTWVPREDAMEKITERIAPLVLRMRREDYLTLPPLVPQYRWLDLPSDARKIYRDVEEHFLAELGDEFILAPSAAAAGVKCRQILNGAIYLSDDRDDWKLVHDVKMDALMDLVDELEGQPLLLLYEFNHDRDRLIEKLKWPAIGQQSQTKDSELIRLFNAGLLPGLIGHPASMGHGLNLQGNCAHVCWFGLTWNLEHYDQAIQRVWRQGNEAPRVMIHHLCIKDSLDESVVRTLEAKERTQTTFMEAIRSLHS